MRNTKLFLDTLDKQKEVSNLKLFREFLDIYPEATKDELYVHNSKLKQMDFTYLIDKYIEDDTTQ